MNILESLLSIGEPVSLCMVDDRIHVAYKQCNAIMENGHPVHVHGSGRSVEAACLNYISKIDGKTLVFRDCTEERKEIIIMFVKVNAETVQEEIAD